MPSSGFVGSRTSFAAGSAGAGSAGAGSAANAVCEVNSEAAHRAVVSGSSARRGARAPENALKEERIRASRFISPPHIQIECKERIVQLRLRAFTCALVAGVRTEKPFGVHDLQRFAAVPIRL